MRRPEEKGFADIVPPQLTPSEPELAGKIRERFADRSVGRVVAEVDGEVRGLCTSVPAATPAARLRSPKSTCSSSIR